MSDIMKFADRYQNVAKEPESGKEFSEADYGSWRIYQAIHPAPVLKVLIHVVLLNNLFPE